jgi:rhodanese-related sulfurtransferase
VDQLGSRLGELSKDKALVVYCQSGMRSARAIKILRGAGYAKAKHMVGGIAAWQGAGLAVTR